MNIDSNMIMKMIQQLKGGGMTGMGGGSMPPGTSLGQSQVGQNRFSGMGGAAMMGAQPGNGTDGAMHKPNIDMKLLMSLLAGGGMGGGNQFYDPFSKNPNYGAGIGGAAQNAGLMMMIKKMMAGGM